MSELIRCCDNCRYYYHGSCNSGSDSEEKEYMPSDLCERHEFGATKRHIKVDEVVSDCYECPLLIIRNIHDKELVKFFCKDSYNEQQSASELYAYCRFEKIESEQENE